MEIQNKRLSDEVFFKEREEVLTQWPTGKDVNLEEAIAYHKAMPESRNFSKKLWTPRRTSALWCSPVPVFLLWRSTSS